MTPAGLWRRLWERAPRQLRFTRDGRVLVAIALATGFAALNTGNNLLYLGWAMILSAIVLSGVLSEATLRVLGADATAPYECRVGVPAAIPVTVANSSERVPAYAVDTSAEIHCRDRSTRALAPFSLRVSPAAETALYARFTPQQRGRHEVDGVVVSTAYPFGFFRKSRRLQPVEKAVFWCLPRRVPVEKMAADISSRLGDAAAPKAGAGEDFFSLRPYRQGDDIRRVHWRRSARTGKWVMVETEIASGRELVLVLVLATAGAGSLDGNEYAIAVTGSLAESLLAKEYRVGLCAPGMALAPAAGAGGRQALLGALARLDGADAVMPAVAATRAARVAVVAAGAKPPSRFDAILSLGGGAVDQAVAGERVL